VVFPFPLSITSKSACQAFTFGGVALVLADPWPKNGVHLTRQAPGVNG
jgi:hypothetical protein